MRHLLKALSTRMFFLFDRMGLHVLPKHYYLPVPDYAWLKRNKKLWTGRASLAGVRWDLDEQLRWLQEVCRPHYKEVAGLGFYEAQAGRDWGPGYGQIESQALHCFIRTFAPRRITEIGSGLSTVCMLNAVRANTREGKTPSTITCIEPHPRRALRDCEGITLVEEYAQAVPSSRFTELQAGDLLFIDSSHTVKIGSEVIRIYLDVIPKLAPGVFIHIHDIYLPYLYPRHALTFYAGWQETALLLALMTGNNHLTPLCCLSALHYGRTAELKVLFSDYTPQENEDGLFREDPPRGHFPDSFWLRTC